MGVINTETYEEKVMRQEDMRMNKVGGPVAALSAMEKDYYERMAQVPPQPTVHHTVNDYPDSIEIGTPAKGGAIKVYWDARDVVGFKFKIDNMVEIRQHAQLKLGGGQ